MGVLQSALRLNVSWRCGYPFKALPLTSHGAAAALGYGSSAM